MKIILFNEKYPIFLTQGYLRSVLIQKNEKTRRSLRFGGSFL